MPWDFEIFGTLIPFSTIKKYRIIQREYIYRPVYREVQQKGFLFSKTTTYEFSEMVPYAAILSDEEYTLATKKASARTVKDSIVKDIAVGVISTVANKLNIKELKYKKYRCINVAGRIFECFMEEIPATIVRGDGKISEVNKNDELYHLLSESIAPAIYIVPALQITADEEYVFYGNGIQLPDVVAEYERLKQEIACYQDQEFERLRIETEYKRQQSLPNKTFGLAKKILSLPKKKDKEN